MASLLETVPYISLLFLTAIIYLEGIPGLRWLVWTARLLLVAGLILWFLKIRRQFNAAVNVPLLFWGFFVYSMASVFWSSSTQPFAAVASDLVTLCLFFFMAINIIQTRAQLQQVLVLINGITLLFALITIARALSSGVLRFGAFPGQDPNVYGFYLLLAMGFQLVFIAAGPQQHDFWPNVALLVVNLISLLITGSRGDFLAFFIMFLLAFLVGSVRKRWLIWAGLMMVLFLLLPPGRALWERFAALAVDRGSKRLDIWWIGWHMIQSHPWFGVGLSNFPTELGSYAAQVKTATTIHPGTGVHDSIIGICSELGLVGLLFFLYLLVTVFNHGWRIVKRFPRNTFENLAIKGLLIASTGIFIASLFLGAYFRKYFWLPWILIEVLYYYQYHPDEMQATLEVES